MNTKKDRKAKVESVYSFYVKTFLNNSVLRNMFVIPKKIVLNCMYKVKIKTGYLKKRQLLRLDMLPPFLTIFLPVISGVKYRSKFCHLKGKPAVIFSKWLI